MIIQNIKKTLRLSKSGKPYASVSIQLEEYKDGKGNLKWISGFGNKSTWAWRKGDDVQPEISEQNGYLNFSFNDTKENKLDVYALPATVGWVFEMLNLNKKSSKSSDGVDEPSPEPENQDAGDEINPDDIPF